MYVCYGSSRYICISLYYSAEYRHHDHMDTDLEMGSATTGAFTPMVLMSHSKTTRSIEIVL